MRMKRLQESLPFDSLSSDGPTTSKHVYWSVIGSNVSKLSSSVALLPDPVDRPRAIYYVLSFSSFSSGNRVEIFIWRYRSGSVIIAVTFLPLSRLPVLTALFRQIIVFATAARFVLFFVPAFLSFAPSSAGCLFFSRRVTQYLSAALLWDL